MKKNFIQVGRAEGTSLLLLFFIAMPLKYGLGMPIFVKIIGMIHGLLFLAYVAMAIMMYVDEKWSKVKLIACLILSCLPFGTFYFERKL